MTDYIIKPMETADEIDGKGYVHYKSWQEAYTGLIDADYLENKMTLEKCISIAHKWTDNLLVAKDGEQVVGFVGYGKYRDDSLADCGEVFSIYVLADYYGKKIGYELMNAALEKLSAYSKIAVWVLKGNERAIRFYERYGFKFDGTEQEIILGTPNTELRMVYTKSQEQIVRWTRRAADHGDRDGQYNLACFYENAVGVERDMEQAVFWYRKAARGDHDLAIQKCIELGVELNAPTIDREVIRKDLRCKIYPLGYLERYKYTVICSSYGGKWILSRHKKRNTWETQGGHIEDGETPLESARRELFEESGIKDADLYPVCDYWGFNTQSCSNGMVFLAVVHSLGELPESEMKEIKIFDTLPDQLTYPKVSPKLYAEAEKLLKKVAKKDL